MDFNLQLDKVRLIVSIIPIPEKINPGSHTHTPYQWPSPIPHRKRPNQ